MERSFDFQRWRNLNIGQTMTAPAGFSLPADVAVQCGENVPMPVVLTATDNCNAPVDVEYNEVFAPGAGPNDGYRLSRAPGRLKTTAVTRSYTRSV
jgi:hypothetical protein